MNQITIKPHTSRIIVQEHLADQEITLEEDAKLTYILFLQKGDELEHTVEFNLNGKCARAQVFGIFLGTGNEQFNLKTFTNHNGQDTYGHIHLKGLLKDSSKVNYYGMLNIEKNAHNADSYLSHRTLLLSKDTRTKSIPALEIKADDVKAGHSASIGQIDEEALFYAQSRGMTEEEAKNLIVEGFLEEFFMNIPEEIIRVNLRKKLVTQYV